jgi:hypothetical protein
MTAETEEGTTATETTDGTGTTETTAEAVIDVAVVAETEILTTAAEEWIKASKCSEQAMQTDRLLRKAQFQSRKESVLAQDGISRLLASRTSRLLKPR